LEAQIGRLKTEKERFKLELEAARIELAKFDEADNQEEQPQKEREALPDDAMHVLFKVAMCPNQKAYSVSQVSLDLAQYEALHYLERLEEFGFILHRTYPAVYPEPESESWEVTKEGRKHLIDFSGF